MTISPLVYRYFAIDPANVTSPCVVMEDSTHYRLAGYAGADALTRAREKAEALAAWAATIGRSATVEAGAPHPHAVLEQAMAVSPIPS